MKQAMRQFKTKKELEDTKAVIDEVIGVFFDRFTSVASTIQNNSDQIKKLVTEEGDELITEEDNRNIIKENG